MGAMGFFNRTDYKKEFINQLIKMLLIVCHSCLFRRS